MATCNLQITCNTDQVLDTISALAEVAERFPHLRQAVLDLVDRLPELVRVVADDRPAAAAGELRVRCELVDPLDFGVLKC